MPLLKLGEKRYYLGIFFKVSLIKLFDTKLSSQSDDFCDKITQPTSIYDTKHHVIDVEDITSAIPARLVIEWDYKYH